jgi:aspartate racemase
MKTIGLIGGMSWESSAEYYRIVNQEVARRLGGLHSAQSLLYSVDFATVEALQHGGRWDEATALMVEAARRVERGGADLVLLCTNTMHRMADAVQDGVAIPLLHIADATGERVRAQGLTTPVSTAVPAPGAAAGDTCPTCGGAPGPGQTGRCSTCVEGEWATLRAERGEEWFHVS